MRRWIALLLASQLLVNGAWGQEPIAQPQSALARENLENLPFQAEGDVLRVDFYSIDSSGNLFLWIDGKDFAQHGFAVGDMIKMTVGSRTFTLPIVLREKDVKKGKLLCILSQNASPQGSRVCLSKRGGSLAGELGLGSDKTGAEQSIYISMAEPGGYVETFLERNMKRSKKREDYPHLSDAQYANFRMVETTGMPSGLLYRSSSPVDDDLGRCREADEALEEAGIHTILNLANSEGKLHSIEGYGSTNYSRRTIFAKKMRSDPMNRKFMKALPKVLRFMMANEGPYLVHCKAGQDRTGFVCALLESLMGATASEVVADYMVTYYNYYGIKPQEERYGVIARHTIQAQLEEAFGIENLWEEGVFLAQGAKRYLQDCGMTSQEIEALKRTLSQGEGQS